MRTSNFGQPGRRDRVDLVVGAGPAGLTAAYELLRSRHRRRSSSRPMRQVGGISKTVNYNGNRIDIGGHRFFSKSDWVMDWWQEILPLEPPPTTASAIAISYQQRSREVRRRAGRARGTGDPDR